MKYDQKFPDSSRWILDEPVDRLVRNSKYTGPCFMCGSETAWIDLTFEGYLCSEECEQEAFAEIRRLAGIEPPECSLEEED